MKVMFVCAGFENIGVEYLSAVLRQQGFHTGLAFDPQLFNDPFLRIGFYIFCGFRGKKNQKT